MARLVTQQRRFPSTGGEVLKVFGSTPPTAFSLLLVPEGRVDSVTPVIQGRWPCQVPDVADSSRLEDHRGTGILWTSGGGLIPAAQIERDVSSLGEYLSRAKPAIRFKRLC